MGRPVLHDYVSIAQEVLRLCGEESLRKSELIGEAEALLRSKGEKVRGGFKENFMAAVRDSELISRPFYGHYALAEETQTTRTLSQIRCSGPDTEKQYARDFLVRQIQKTFANPKEELRFLDFPGKEGMTNPDSVSNQLRNYFDNVYMVGLEENRHEYAEMLEIVDESGFSELLQMSAEKYFEKCWSFFDVMWLDYYGGTKKSVVESWKNMFEAEMLREPGVLAITICESGRAAFDYAEVKCLILRMGKEAGYKITAFGDHGYNQERRNPMRILVFRVS